MDLANCFSWPQLYVEDVFGGVRALGQFGEVLHLSTFHTAVKRTGGFHPSPPVTRCGCIQHPVQSGDE